jgi:hypothetical protein
MLKFSAPCLLVPLCNICADVSEQSDERTIAGFKEERRKELAKVRI